MALGVKALQQLVPCYHVLKNGADFLRPETESQGYTQPGAAVTDKLLCGTLPDNPHGNYYTRVRPQIL